MDDFKLISRMVIFHLGEINNIMIFSSGNELKIIHYVQTWPPDVKNFKKSRQQFLQSASKFDRLKNWVADCSAQGRNLTKSF